MACVGAAEGGGAPQGGDKQQIWESYRYTAPSHVCRYFCSKILSQGTNIAFEEPPATAALTLDDVQVEFEAVFNIRCHPHLCH